MGTFVLVRLEVIGFDVGLEAGLRVGQKVGLELGLRVGQAVGLRVDGLCVDDRLVS